MGLPVVYGCLTILFSPPVSYGFSPVAILFQIVIANQLKGSYVIASALPPTAASPLNDVKNVKMEQIKTDIDAIRKQMEKPSERCNWSPFGIPWPPGFHGPEQKCKEANTLAIPGLQAPSIMFWSSSYFSFNGLSNPAAIKGEPGLQGAPGEKGDEGIPGWHGLPGIYGEKGDAGYKGATGLPGLDGRQGEKGEMGLTGFPGVEGEPGWPGFPGSKGDVGVAGPPGMPSIPGGKGDSAVADYDSMKGIAWG